MRIILLSTAMLCLAVTSNAQFPKVLKDAGDQVMGKGGSGLSNDEVIAGLKEALGKGAEQSVLKGSAADGFWKNDKLRIPFPPEAEKMKSTLNGIGMTKQVEEFELTMNRAAGDFSAAQTALAAKFRLVRYAEEPSCDNWNGPDAWPTLWITR
jgi:hypothetical protein